MEMAKGKHTAGPWINGGEGRSIGRNEEMTFILAATQENVTKKEQRANVRLACAAPELLKALENAYADINWLLVEGFDTNADECNLDGVRDTIAEIKQALATAKGEV